MSDNIRELITQRRRQMLVHSFIYYRLGTSIISDATFDRWAYELRDLQRSYPEIAAACPFAAEFAGWDGTTGFNLPLYGEWLERKAAQLLRYHNERVT
jgi:hypothetical protein